MSPPPIRRLGLTGGIGSGKSTVAAVWAALGVAVVDTDAIARALTGPGGGAMAPLRDRFGDEILRPDGALDRDRMRRLAFADPAARQRLEAVLHPLIGAEAERQALAAAPRCVLFDVPLLTESTHWRARVERVLVVDCPEDTQVERVMQRSGWQAQAVRDVIAAQAPRAKRRAIADAVIDNGPGITLAHLERAVHELARHWTGLA